MGWVGVDLDSTLAHYEKGDFRKYGPLHIGQPIKRMVERVKNWLREGKEVKIMTARAFEPDEGVIEAIELWCEEYIGVKLEVTCIKDGYMDVLYDDKARQVVPNRGDIVCSPYV